MATPDTTIPRDHEHRFVIIIGGGASGILQAAELLRTNLLPHEDLAILDRYEDFGGCLLANRYPGCAVDTPNLIYSISWFRNPDWSRKFVPRDEMLAYFQRAAKHFGLQRSAYFNTNVVKASWIEGEMLWLVESADTRTGETKYWTCNALVTALGPFSLPKTADVPGIEDFQGRQWHGVSWPEDADLKGKRVAVVGTGPTAAQLIPEIYPEVAELLVYQRSPGHCFPRRDHEIGKWTRWVYRKFPWAMNLHAWIEFRSFEYYVYKMCRVGTVLQSLMTKWAKWHMVKQVKDEKKREKLICHDHFVCKRPLFLDNYYTTLDKDNVELLTGSLVEITKTGLRHREENGTISHREVDVIVWGTGYRMTKPGANIPIFGRGGKLLKVCYGKELYCLYGVALDEFPNMMNIIGPYSVAFWSSIIKVMELNSVYNTQAIRYLVEINKEDGFRRAVMPRRDFVIAWVDSLREEQKFIPAAVETCRTFRPGQEEEKEEAVISDCWDT